MSLISRASEKMWNDADFQQHYSCLKLNNVKRNLGIPYADSVNFEALLRAASLFSLVDDQDAYSLRYHDAAFRIAYCVRNLWPDQNIDLSHVIALLLVRIGNFPSLLLLDDSKKQGAGEFILNIIERYSLQTALEILGKYENNLISIEDIHHSERSTILELTNFQRELWQKLSNSSKLLSFASPTSSGKSHILMKFISHKAQQASKPFCAVYLVPTRALIAEIAVKLRGEISKSKEEIDIITIPKAPSEVGKDKIIYVLTQERFLVLLAMLTSREHSVDYLIVDEAHEISKGSRGILLHHALDWVKNRFTVKKYIFCSPVIKNPGIFDQLLSGRKTLVSEEISTQLSPVTQNFIKVWPAQGGRGQKGNNKKLLLSLYDVYGNTEEAICTMEFEQNRHTDGISDSLAYASVSLGQNKTNIVYVDDPKMADDTAKKLVRKYITDVTDDDEVIEFADYVKKIVHPRYLLGEALKKGVGIHYGKMPTLIRETVEQLFKEGKLKFIVCTSTLAQGVNLPAQNIFIMNPKVRDVNSEKVNVGSSTFWNIVGRAGRLFADFEGNVFLIHDKNNKSWEDQYLSEERVTTVRPAIEECVLKSDAAVEAQLRGIRTPAVGKKDGGEEAASNFIYDLAISPREDANDFLWLNEDAKKKIDRLSQIAREIEDDIKLPHYVVTQNVGISPAKQQALYDFLHSQPLLRPWNLERPYHQMRAERFSNLRSNYKQCFERMYVFLSNEDFSAEEKKKYFNKILHTAIDWVIGKPLSEMVSNYIGFEALKKPSVDDNPDAAIRQFFELLDGEVRFKLVKYVHCYISIFRYVCQQRKEEALLEEIPDSLPVFLEIGACAPLQVGLMSIGISRTSALELYKIIGKANYNKDTNLLQLIEKSDYRSKLPMACVKEINRLLNKG